MKRLTGIQFLPKLILKRMKFLGSILVAACLWSQAGCVAPDSQFNGLKPDAGLKASFGKNDLKPNSYDSALVDAVSRSWYEILEKHNFKSHEVTTAVINFKLHPDGTISDIKIVSCKGSMLLSFVCEEAIQETAPFKPWTPDMIRMVGDGQKSRDITFTFNYYK